MVLLLALCLVSFVPARAGDGQWTMAAVDGVAMVIAQGNEGHAARQGHPLAAGATLVTGEDGTTTLVRRGDSMTVYPNSEVTIPEFWESDGLGVVQGLGKLLFRMETRESRNFEVHTPFLAATVKGTVFTVEVTAENASVTVTEGSVLVAPTRGGRSHMVHAGNRATVNASSAHQVKVEVVAAGQPESGSKGKGRGKPAGGPPPNAGLENGKAPGNAVGGNDSPGRDSQGDNSRGGGPPGGKK